jgi:hypothetical protein
MNNKNIHNAVTELLRTVKSQSNLRSVEIDKYHVFFDFYWASLSYTHDDACGIKGLSLKLSRYYSSEPNVSFGSTSISRLTGLPVTLTRSGKAYCMSEGDKVLALFEDYYTRDGGFIVSLKVAPDFKFDSLTGECVPLKMPLKGKTVRDKLSENKFIRHVGDLYTQVVTLASFNNTAPDNRYTYTKLCMLPIPVVKYSESGIRTGIGYVKSYYGTITSENDLLGLKKIIDGGDSPIGFISDINEDSLSELFEQMKGYKLRTFPFMDNMVLVEFGRNETCYHKGLLLVPLKSLFSKFELVPVTFSNMNDVIDPLDLSAKKVTSVYFESDKCDDKIRHYFVGQHRKVFFGDSVEVLCNKLTEIADEIRKQLQ